MRQTLTLSVANSAEAALPTTALPGAWVMGQEIDKYVT